MSYRTTANADGTHTVHDVPIFEECHYGGRTFGVTWIESAFHRSKDQDIPIIDRSYTDIGLARLTRSSIQDDGILRVFADLTVTKLESISGATGGPVIFNPDGPPRFDQIQVFLWEVPFFTFPPLLFSRDGQEEEATPKRD